MKIETKFDIDTDICFLHENRLIHTTVREIGVTVNCFNKIEVVYRCNKEEDGRVFLKVEEERAFKTKKELLDSL